MSSGTNVLTIILAARALSVRAFGAFGVVVGLALVGIALTRTLSVEPLLVHRRDQPAFDLQKADRSAVGTAVALGLILGSLALVVGNHMSGVSGESIRVMAAFVPALTCQDAVRYVFFARRQPLRAAGIDVVWGAVVLVGVLCGPELTAPRAAFIWGLGALVSGLLGLALARLVPNLSGAAKWMRSTRHLTPYYFLEYLVSSGTVQVAILLLAWVAGLDAVAAVRANQTIFGLVNTIFAGAYVALVPRAVAALDRAPERGPKIALSASAFFACIAVAWSAVVWAVPDRLGDALFGDTWGEAAPLVLPYGIAAAILAGGAGPLLALRSTRQARSSLRIRLASIPFSLGLPMIGAHLGSARGFVVGMGAAYSVTTMLWWRTWRQYSSGTRSEPPRVAE